MPTLRADGGKNFEGVQTVWLAHCNERVEGEVGEDFRPGVIDLVGEILPLGTGNGSGQVEEVVLGLLKIGELPAARQP